MSRHYVHIIPKIRTGNIRNATCNQFKLQKKKLAPGSTVNNELILSVRAKSSTSVLEQAVLFWTHTEEIHSPLVKTQLGKKNLRTLKSCPATLRFIFKRLACVHLLESAEMKTTDDDYA